MQVTRGDLAALVRDKSRSVQDLMVLTHLEPMSDVIEYAGAATRQVKHNENEFFFLSSSSRLVDELVPCPV